MSDVYGGPFGTYAAAGVINGAAKDAVGAMLVELARLLGITLTAGNGIASVYSLKVGVDSPHPDFDAVRPEMRDKIGRELQAIALEMDTAAEA